MRDAVQFLKSAKLVDEIPVALPVAPGVTEEFIRLKPRLPSFSDKTIFNFGTAYYTATDLRNKIISTIRLINNVANGRQPDPEPPWTTDDKVSFEHAGDTYLPQGTRYNQIALYMKYQYGVDFSTSITNDEAKKKAGGVGKYELKTSALPPEIREAALADLKSRIEGRDDVAAPQKASFKTSRLHRLAQ